MTVCLWCRLPIVQPERRRGSEKKFCCAEHKTQFWLAARHWIALAIETGLISSDDLKRAWRSVYASDQPNKPDTRPIMETAA